MRRLLASVFLFMTVAAHGLQAEPVKLTHQGLTLNAELAKTGDDWRRGPVVLMTHGTIAHNGMEIMKGLQGMLKSRGISSLAINLSLGLDDRASAMYECATPHIHRHADAVDEIGAWMDWLKAEGADNVALLGHSRGRNQASRFAAERPDAGFSRVFLIAPGGWDFEHAAEHYQERYGKDLDPILQKAHDLVAAGKGDQLIQPLDFIYCEQTAASAAAVVGYYDAKQLRGTGDLLAKIRVPVTVFIGSEDTSVPNLEENVGPLADGEQIRMEVLDGAGHFFRDLYSEDIADMIAEALES